ncbi:MAG: ABC transporter permease [Rhodobacteraceae bacterium]|nr:ABC transporter permease [Paracoccaceae bacterium]
MRSILTLLGALLLGLGLWQGLVMVTGVPRFILPGPILVAETIWTSRALIAEHAIVTFAEVLLGLCLGGILGAATAILLAASALMRAMLQPILVFTQAVPVFALAPVLTLWLGYGLWPKIAMTLLIIYFPVASAFLDALLRTPQGFLDMARVMGARPERVLLRIRIPAALPGLASGLRLAAVYAPIGAIIGEWVGASRGLGYLMLLASGRAKTDLMFAALIMLALFTILLHKAVDWTAQRVLDSPDSTA